jgi:hypothetical protein
MAVSSLVCIGIWGGVILGRREPKLEEMVVSAILPMFGVLWVAFSFLSTVTLFVDALEHRTLLGRKRLPFEGIRGRREYFVDSYESGSTRYLKLEPNDDRLPTLDFQKYYTFDREFYEWFNNLPDLDAMDRLKGKNSSFGLI